MTFATRDDDHFPARVVAIKMVSIFGKRSGGGGGGKEVSYFLWTEFNVHDGVKGALLKMMKIVSFQFETL